MTDFKNAYILCYSPEQVRAVVDEGERLGYKRRNATNYKGVTLVRFTDEGDLFLITRLDDDLDYYITVATQHYPDIIRIMQTRHIRTVLAPLGEVLSQDGNSVLRVGQNPVERKSWLSAAKSWVVAQMLAMIVLGRRVFGFLTGK